MRVLPDNSLDRDGFCVLRGLVPEDVVDEALRVLTLEVVRRGVSAEQIHEWSQATFFPHLRWEPQIIAVRDHIEPHVPRGDGDQWADAQLVVRFPDEAPDWPLEPHVDELPPWADGRSYRVIAGVALTRARRKDGALAVWPGSHRGAGAPEPLMLEFDPGDVILMHPHLHHSSTLNRGGSMRVAVYYRLLSP